MSPTKAAKAGPLPKPSVLLSEKPSLSIEEAAALTSIGRTTLYGAMRDGFLKRVKVGRRSVILRTELDRWLNEMAAQQ